MREQYNGLIQSIALCLFTLFYFPGCRQQSFSVGTVKHQQPLFIELPHSVNIFESLERDTYAALYNEYKRHGYYVVKKADDAKFILKVIIKRYDTPEKLISPDVIPYLLRQEIEIEIVLLDKAEKALATKTFVWSQWHDRPSNVRLNSHVARFDLRELLDRNVSRIERCFRPYFLPDKKS